jgi:hypothetical protein
MCLLILQACIHGLLVTEEIKAVVMLIEPS